MGLGHRYIVVESDLADFEAKRNIRNKSIEDNIKELEQHLNNFSLARDEYFDYMVVHLTQTALQYFMQIGRIHRYMLTYIKCEGEGTDRFCARVSIHVFTHPRIHKPDYYHIDLKECL